MHEALSSATARSPLPGLPHTLPELAGVTRSLRENTLACAQILSYPAGTNLDKTGDATDKLLIVLQGVVKVFAVDDDGREVALHRVRDGQLCVLALARMLHGAGRCPQAIAEKQVRLLAISREQVDRLLAASDEFRRLLLTSMACCLSDIMRLVDEVSFYHLDTRLARLIRQLADQSPTGELHLTHQALANELGTTRDVVSRLLRRFQRAGLIKLGRRNIRVLNADELAALAQ